MPSANTQIFRLRIRRSASGAFLATASQMISCAMMAIVRAADMVSSGSACGAKYKSALETDFAIRSS